MYTIYIHTKPRFNLVLTGATRSGYVGYSISASTDVAETSEQIQAVPFQKSA